MHPCTYPPAVKLGEFLGGPERVGIVRAALSPLCICRYSSIMHQECRIYVVLLVQISEKTVLTTVVSIIAVGEKFFLNAETITNHPGAAEIRISNDFSNLRRLGRSRSGESTGSSASVRSRLGCCCRVAERGDRRHRRDRVVERNIWEIQRYNSGRQVVDGIDTLRRRDA